MPFAEVKPVLMPMRETHELCKKPYYNHSKGCPNFGKKAGCPPNSRMLEKEIDLEQPVWAVWNDFDVAAHVGRMQKRHPDWSERQLVCCLYWQGRARKALKTIFLNFQLQHIGLRIVPRPEACGVNLTRTMATVSVDLEWPPRMIARQIVLAGSPAGGRPGGAGKVGA